MQTVNQIKCRDCQSITPAYTSTICRECFEKNAARDIRFTMSALFVDPYKANAKRTANCRN